jgi:hypothetical protein
MEMRIAAMMMVFIVPPFVSLYQLLNHRMNFIQPLA